MNEKSGDLKLMRQMYDEIRKADVPGSDVSGILDRVKGDVWLMKSVNREGASRMLSRHLFYGLHCGGDNAVERVSREIQEAANDKRKELERLAGIYKGKIILGDTSFEDWLRGLDSVARSVSSNYSNELI